MGIYIVKVEKPGKFFKRAVVEGSDSRKWDRKLGIHEQVLGKGDCASTYIVIYTRLHGQLPGRLRF
jgi:hypothetical protein